MTLAMPHTLLELTDSSSPRAGRMLALSLVLHCALLALIANIRLAPKVERPLASYQVSLVTLPAPARPRPAPSPIAKPVEPVPAPRVEEVPVQPPAPPKPLPQVQARPAPIAKPEPTPAPPVKPTAPRASPLVEAPPPREALKPSPPPADPLRDVFKGIELPPEAPKLGEIPPPVPAAPARRSQASRPTPAAPKVSSRIQDLQVPEVKPAPRVSMPAPVTPVQEQTGPIVSPDLLEKLRQPIDPIQRPPETRPIERKEIRSAIPKPASPPPDATASAQPLQTLAPTTAIQTSGAQGNPYWTLIRQRIDSRWVAPPVDLTRRSFQVVIRFRLDRGGKVSDVAVERSSGNDYYDNAGKRAVLAADPLPPFPADITERQITTYCIFTVGEQAG
jgi:colicin import membrane protein